MEKRYLFELSEDELKKVLEVNESFRDLLVEMHHDGIDDFVHEAITILRSGNIIDDYSIYQDDYSYISFNEFHYDEALDSMKEFIETYGANNEVNEKIQKAFRYREFINEAYRLFDYYNYLNFDNQYSVDRVINEKIYDELFTQIIDELSRLISKELSIWYDYDDDVLLNILEIEFKVNDTKRFYIKDDSYIVYETMERKYG